MKKHTNLPDQINDFEEFEGTTNFWDTKTDWKRIGIVVFVMFIICGAIYLGFLNGIG